VLTATGLNCLLARLDADASRAGLEYERLRRTLVRFFEWRGAESPDVCADEALDRLARRLEEETTVKDVFAYGYGIARLVLLEQRRQPAFTSLDGLSERPPVVTADDLDDQRALDCLDRCLGAMEAAGRSLVLSYYEGERRSKMDNRRRLAEAFGLSDNALRSRVQRLRDRLQACIERCQEGR
jgi:DNA-directed RNA polymerase specialized sigma24 family protein